MIKAVTPDTTPLKVGPPQSRHCGGNGWCRRQVRSPVFRQARSPTPLASTRKRSSLATPAAPLSLVCSPLAPGTALRGFFVCSPAACRLLLFVLFQGKQLHTRLGLL